MCSGHVRNHCSLAFHLGQIRHALAAQGVGRNKYTIAPEGKSVPPHLPETKSCTATKTADEYLRPNGNLLQDFARSGNTIIEIGSRITVWHGSMCRSSWRMQIFGMRSVAPARRHRRTSTKGLPGPSDLRTASSGSGSLLNQSPKAYPDIT